MLTGQHTSPKLGLNFLQYSDEKPYQGQTGIVVSLEQHDIGLGTIGIASVLDSIINTSSGDEWPSTFHPLATISETQKFVYESEYLAIHAECLGAMNYQADTNSDGDFSNASFWVEVVFDSDSEDSMDELLHKVCSRCVELAYMPDLMTVRPQPVDMPDLVWDQVWSHVDGLYQKRIFDILDGRCSLEASLTFDLEIEENQLKKDLEDFNKYTPSPCYPE